MLRLFNSMGRRVEPFVPRDPGQLRMYVCGPTVYSYAHIGNARPAVVFDVLTRVLRARFPRLTYARNITDVDDKIIAAAAAAGVPCDAISARFTAAYHADLAALGVLPPDVEPRATDHISQMIAIIEELIAAGHAYAAEGHALFHVPSFAAYGRLSGANPDEIRAGARVEVAPWKRDPRDFVLWKPSQAGQPGWDSPWGFGRPGWHIECTAMIRTHLGDHIDIHGGGIDLRFPHHENEIAQGTDARFWVHNGHVTVSGAKMSKSLGNVLLVRDLLADMPGEAIRYALLSAQYRQPLDWTDETPHAARAALDRLYGALRDQPPAEAQDEDMAPVRAALDDDLNAPAALAALHALAGQIHAATDPARRAELAAALRQAGGLLGLLEQDPTAWSQAGAADVARIEALIAERACARAAHDWARADALRDKLTAMGVEIEDADGESRWRVRA
ncbi:cysteine--tRNA ligase [Pseudooceanicola sp. GBMRC 2024]|uniref:Cysteine--tRNA ligase n=1 Tax=Pseudooceanicola albus TaxID=2692189 RepID=A0A6L7G9W3_9RHOB|nr:MULTISPECIES: cysteine--tRNA ligase [Pseudooceanicola]MXN20739.1 cysteine--tRNA ligase [Pseudooceanicola albus]